MPNWKTILRDFIIIIIIFIGFLSTNARRKAHKPERNRERFVEDVDAPLFVLDT